MPIPAERIDLVGPPARDLVYEKLLGQVVDGTLAPGAQLRDVELLATTETSRAPLREALNRLETLGLVRVVPRQLTEVTPIGARRTVDSLEVLGEVVARVLVESAGRLTVADERLARELQHRVRDDDGAVATLTDPTVLPQLVGWSGNDEYRFVGESLWPYARRSLVARRGDVDVTAWRTALTATFDAALDGDGPASARAWLVAARVMADPFRDGPAGPDPTPRTPTLRERAAQVIQTAIFDGTLKPDEVLRESDLMTWLGVSRTPVRDALSLLAARRLVVLTPNRSARVASMDRAACADACRALGVVRCASLRRAMTAAPAGPLPWAAALEGVRSAPTSDAQITAVNALSAAIHGAAGNAVAAELGGQLEARLQWNSIRDPFVLAVTRADELLELLDVLGSGDVDRTVELQARLYDTLADIA